jgi:hypothetical protein
MYRKLNGMYGNIRKALRALVAKDEIRLDVPRF